MFFILVPALVWMLTSGNVATAGFADSAHGDDTDGVERSACQYPNPSPPPDFLDCPTGSCAHCHDTFDSDICTGVTGGPYQLFAANDNDFCLKCHDNTTNYATTAIVNRSYSYRAGGYDTDPVDDVREAFSLASSHDLVDIKTFISGKWGYTSGSNPCTACHNQHMAEGDPENAPDALKSASTRGWPLARPSAHNIGTWGLWGDDSSERMSEYVSDPTVGDYQAPYRISSPAAYEPDGSSTTDGSNLTDFNTFCLDCHANEITRIDETTVRAIDWVNEVHGKGDPDYAGDPDTAKLCGDPPYPSGGALGYGKVLSCLDCHEPHGSPNVTLIRKKVNAGTLSVSTVSQDGCPKPSDSQYNKEIANLCNRCHKNDNQIDSGCSSLKWYKIHHKDSYDTGCNTDSPYKGGEGARQPCNWCHYYASAHDWGCNMDPSNMTPITCTCCHYHGSYVDADTWNFPDYNPKYRRTF
jgi:hypothetical protein